MSEIKVILDKIKDDYSLTEYGPPWTEFNEGYRSAVKDFQSVIDKLTAALERSMTGLEKIKVWTDPQHYISPQAIWADQSCKEVVAILKDEAGAK